MLLFLLPWVLLCLENAKEGSEVYCHCVHEFLAEMSSNFDGGYFYSNGVSQRMVFVPLSFSHQKLDYEVKG